MLNNQQLTIIFDLDDTIAELKTPMTEALNKLTGKDLHYNDLYQFQITDIYGISDQDLFNCIIDNKLLENMQPYPETRGLLTDLIKNGYNVNIITSRAYHHEARKVTIDWFAKYDIPFTRLIVSEHGKKKSDYITEEENVIVAIDDRIENCEDFIESGKTKIVRLHDMPWNKNSTLPRITNISQVRSLLKM